MATTATPLELQRLLSRFKLLPVRDDVWEGAVADMPTWVEGGPDGEPFRPRAAVWVSTRTGIAHLKNLRPGGTDEHPYAIAALLEMGTLAKLAGSRPRGLRVRDGALAASLETALQGLAGPIEIVDDVPAVRAFLREMAAAVSADEIPPALNAPGVTPDRLRTFADAAKNFFEAAPWRHLSDGDLIEIEAPKAGRGLTLLGVMGSAGEQFGVGFFSSRTQYRRILDGAPPSEILAHGGEWAIYFSPGWETPFADLDAWDRFGLPLASPHAYPCAMRLDRNHEPQRPDAGRLAHFEGLLRTLAATTETEMDSGRWSHTVTTAESTTTYTLTLPDLLSPEIPRAPRLDPRSMERLHAEIARTLRDSEFESIADASAAVAAKFTGVNIDELASTAQSPLERAQDLMHDAFDARGRRQLHLIRRALEISPDCADAYALLAQRASSPPERRRFYEEAVAAGERALGPSVFADPEQSFWGDVATRPYIRARAALAECLLETDDFDGATWHFRALLRLNPGDNQGIRFRLLATLLRAGRDAEAGDLLEAHDDASALWRYGAVLLALRSGDARLARSRLRGALKANRKGPRYLTGDREIPDPLPSHYAWGSDEEAVLCADDLIDAWAATPNAVAWLRAEMRSRK